MPETSASGSLEPLHFAREILNVQLWSKQEEVLSALTHNRRVAVKSGNGLGKGFSAAVAVLWFLYCHDPAVVLSTAPTFRQVRHILWRQIHRLYRNSKTPLGGKMLETRWELADDRYAIGLSADTADQFQGFHSDNLLIVVDEAEGVSDEIYEAIESVMTSALPRLLLIGNPTTVSGAFRRAFYQERRLYYTITISALDSPNVIAGTTVVPGLATAEWVEERRETWGEDNPIYVARVLGEFPDQAEDTLIKLSDIEAAALGASTERAAPDSAVESTDAGTVTDADDEVVLAVDVARFGSDSSVILRRRGTRVEKIQTYHKMDTMELTGWVVAAIQECRPDRMYIDEIGVGAGVVDRLREMGYGVRGINVAKRAGHDELFANRRAEGFWHLRELFATGRIAIPSDNQLMGELAALRYSYDSQGRLLMESKDSMRQRGLPSPDKADALMLAFLEPAQRVKLWI
ncbi:MAG: hypothetical protein J4N78_12635 [Chloroflexi bacterium]|nr:hypothetical protein [Chloroflexota bacterium]